MAWAPDYRKEFIRRSHLLQKAAREPRTRAALMLFYKSHPTEWIEDFCITYNPRNSGIKTLPFLLFPRQRDFIDFLGECVRDKECGLVEKCRDGGLTWLCCAYSVWMWIFTDGASIGFGSRKELLVDRIGDPDSIFEKLRTIIRFIPSWMLPDGFAPRVNLSFMKITNPKTGANIKGEAGDNIGRGGRSTVYFKDESAHYEHPESVEAALGDNTDVQIDISSVNGTANVFYRRRMAGEVWVKGSKIPKGVTRVFVFDWRDDPRKSIEWYEQRRSKAEREALLHIFAQEVDRDYSSAVVGVIIPQEWIKSAIDAHIRIGFKDDGEKVAAQDVADGGGDKNALIGRRGIVATYAEAWAGEAGDAARHSVPLCHQMGMGELYYDCIGVGSGYKEACNGMMLTNLSVLPWNAAESPLKPDDHIIPYDLESPTNGDFFMNLKAQAWWSVRTRFYKTFMAVTRGVVYPHDELISLSSVDLGGAIHQLVIELSQATSTTNGKGKLLVDKKPDGASSPNLADAFVMCYYPTRSFNPRMWEGLID